MQKVSIIRKYYSKNTVLAILITIVVLIVIMLSIAVLLFDYYEIKDEVLDFSFYDNVRESYFVK